MNSLASCGVGSMGRSFAAVAAARHALRCASIPFSASAGASRGPSYAGEPHLWGFGKGQQMLGPNMRQRLGLCCASAGVEPKTGSSSTDATPSQTPKQATSPTFQQAIRRLQDYWSDHGCAVWLPHSTEVGAGTMNPATFLRVLGPEPWNVCYAEPSIRPDDSRFGDNPNRVQRHTQFQVILKPEPGNAQELYLGSLQALGIDVHAHDIRFVEDNWESPVLGAWGLGWEVWVEMVIIKRVLYIQLPFSMSS